MKLPRSDTPEDILQWLAGILPDGLRIRVADPREGAESAGLADAEEESSSESQKPAFGHSPEDFGLCELEEIWRKKQLIRNILELLGMNPNGNLSAEVLAQKALELQLPASSPASAPGRPPGGPRRGRIASTTHVEGAPRFRLDDRGISSGHGTVTWVAFH